MTAATPQPLWIVTFGYGNEANPDQRLVRELDFYNLRLMVDTRDDPNSARLGSWKHKALQRWFETLPDSSVMKDRECRYVHAAGFGNIPDTSGARSLPWNRPDDWMLDVEFYTGALFGAGRIGLMCCEGEPFERLRKSDSSDLSKPRCHRLEVAEEIARSAAKFGRRQIIVVHLRPDKLDRMRTPIVYEWSYTKSALEYRHFGGLLIEIDHLFTTYGTTDNPSFQCEADAILALVNSTSEAYRQRVESDTETQASS